MPEKVFEFTSEGIEELQKELEERKTVISAEVADRLATARAQGDLSENAEYDEAKELQAANEVRIAEIENMLKNARIIDDSEISASEVSLGSLVTILDVETAEKSEYQLVSSSEENIFANKLSNSSPIGAAIMGKKKNDVVKVKTPVGFLDYKIIKISRPKKK